MKKEMDKLIAVFVLGILIITILPGVLADEDIRSVTEKMTTGVAGFIQGIQDGVTSTLNETQFVRVLFFILVFLIIVSILSAIPLFEERKGIKILISIVITILSVMFIPTELIMPMLNPYSALGVALISIIPFALMFFFTQYMLINTFLKKIAWMFFAIYLLGITIYTSISTPIQEGLSANTIYIWVYGVASVLALLMVFFNKWIDEHIWSGKMEAKMNNAQKKMQKRIAVDQLKEQEANAQGLGE